MPFQTTFYAEIGAMDFDDDAPVITIMTKEDI